MIYKLDDVCNFINGGAWSDKEYVLSGIMRRVKSVLYSGKSNLIL
jgi:hypothetical protein